MIGGAENKRCVGVSIGSMPAIGLVVAHPMTRNSGGGAVFVYPLARGSLMPSRVSVDARSFHRT